jgi:hypothetical protein
MNGGDREVTLKVFRACPSRRGRKGAARNFRSIFSFAAGLCLIGFVHMV